MKFIVRLAAAAALFLLAASPAMAECKGCKKKLGANYGSTSGGCVGGVDASGRKCGVRAGQNDNGPRPGQFVKPGSLTDSRSSNSTPTLRPGQFAKP